MKNHTLKSLTELIQDETQHHKLRIYFIGIGGIGMSALARYFNAYGAAVFGYDLSPTLLTKNLENEGITIFYKDEVALLPNDMHLVVYTPAIPAHHQQLNFFRNNEFMVLKRSDVLQIITAQKFTIAIAGSHGKTTVTSLIAHIFLQAKINCRAFLGGLPTGYNANFLQYNANADATPTVCIVEADEFDRSFLKLKPNIAIITAIDTDHLDVYGTKENITQAFQQFAQALDPLTGKLILQERIQNWDNAQLHVVKYGYSAKADFRADDIVYHPQENSFSIYHKNNLFLSDVKIQMGGTHNIENALAAITTASQYGIDKNLAKAAIQNFKGIKRRFEIVVQNKNHILIDDYAHHPEEIAKCIEGIKLQFPKKKLMVIFQPHLFSRTHDLFQEFAQALQAADKIILLDIYPAREAPIEGVSTQLIFNAIAPNHDKMYVPKDELLNFLKSTNLPEIICTMGAGNIDALVSPIKDILS